MSIKREGEIIPSENTSPEVNGKEEMQEYIGEVENLAATVLNKYEGFSKIFIEINGETKEIYLENETLKVDSSKWEEKVINGAKVKINPEGDIIEYLEWAEAGEQIFTWYAAIRESKKQGKRLPLNDELDAILDKVGFEEEFMKYLPGYYDSEDKQFRSRGFSLFLWSAFYNHEDYAYVASRIKEGAFYNQSFLSKNEFVSVRSIMD